MCEVLLTFALVRSHSAHTVVADDLVLVLDDDELQNQDSIEPEN